MTVLFLRPYTLKRTVVKSERPKEHDPEAGAVASNEKPAIEDVAAEPRTPVDEEARRSTSKSRTSDAVDEADAGTIAGEPEMGKEIKE